MYGQMKIDISEYVAEIDHRIQTLSLPAVRTYAIECVKSIRNELLHSKNSYSDEEKELLYSGGVFIRGVIDYIFLAERVSVPGWNQDRGLVATVWKRLWDCNDRIKACNFNRQLHLTQLILNLLSMLKKFYRENYGPGIYVSPETKVKYRECSICGRNIKECAHIPGRVYSGLPCRQICRDLEGLSVSLVDNPEDPRCRIWPWNCNEETRIISKIPVLIPFLIDDFLFEEDWEKRV